MRWSGRRLVQGLMICLGVSAGTSGRAVAQTPASPAATEAAAAFQAQDWPAAVTAYQRVVGAEPENGLAWLRLGWALVETGDPEAAIEAIDRVAGTGLRTPFVQVVRARALASLGRRDAAISALEEIQPGPGLGGAAGLTGIEEFSSFTGDPRFDAVVAAFEAAAWPCRADPLSRAFDFWIGDWDVYVNGNLAGRNTIELMLGDCTLLENWTSAGNREGKSFNWVDRSSFREPRWRQLWVADQGNTLDYYDGHYSDGAMRFEGHTFSAAGDSILQKLRFENVAADTVRQVFEQSTDGGATWVVTFDGLYVRRSN